MAPTTELELHAHYPLSDEQVQAFRANGCIKLKQVFSAETLAYHGAAIDGQVRAFAEANNMPWEARDTYQKAFIQVMNIWLKDDTVKAFVFSKRLARLAAELMGIRGVRLYHDQALYKEPTHDTAGHTPWHADQYYWPIDTPNTVTAWIPLEAVPLKSGPLAFAPRSHGFLSGRDLAISDDSEFSIEQSLTEAGYDLVAEPFDLGEISFHCGWCFHRAEPNRGPSTRRVMTVIYIDRDATVAEPKNSNQSEDLAAWLPGLEPGEPAASKINPVLWEEKA